MEQPKFAKHSLITWILAGILLLILLIGSFALGTMTGFRRASFSCHWGERYGDMMGMPFPGRGKGFEAPQQGMFDAHGANGIVVSVKDQQLVVKGPDGIEKTVNVTSTTDIRKGPVQVTSTSQIAPNDRVVIFGNPNESGIIDATLIRIFDQKFLPK